MIDNSLRNDTLILWQQKKHVSVLDTDSADPKVNKKEERRPSMMQVVEVVDENRNSG